MKKRFLLMSTGLICFSFVLLKSNNKLEKDLDFNLMLLEQVSLDNASLLKYIDRLKKEREDFKGEVIRLENELEKLNKKAVFDSSDLRKLSNVSERELKLALVDTNMLELVPYIIEAERRYNVNAIFITSLIANESAWNTSQKATTMNNITGFGVYNHKVTSRGKDFKSKADCIFATAQLLSESYLSKDGSFYNGKSVEGVNVRYCLNSDGTVDYNWSKTIISISNNLKKDINSF